jgi:hypothetical protein
MMMKENAMKIIATIALVLLVLRATSVIDSDELPEDDMLYVQYEVTCALMDGGLSNITTEICPSVMVEIDLPNGTTERFFVMSPDYWDYQNCDFEDCGTGFLSGGIRHTAIKAELHNDHYDTLNDAYGIHDIRATITFSFNMKDWHESPDWVLSTSASVTECSLCFEEWGFGLNRSDVKDYRTIDLVVSKDPNGPACATANSRAPFIGIPNADVVVSFSYEELCEDSR